MTELTSGENNAGPLASSATPTTTPLTLVFQHLVESSGNADRHGKELYKRSSRLQASPRKLERHRSHAADHYVIDLNPQARDEKHLRCSCVDAPSTRFLQRHGHQSSVSLSDAQKPFLQLSGLSKGEISSGNPKESTAENTLSEALASSLSESLEARHLINALVAQMQSEEEADARYARYEEEFDIQNTEIELPKRAPHFAPLAPRAHEASDVRPVSAGMLSRFQQRQPLCHQHELAQNTRIPKNTFPEKVPSAFEPKPAPLCSRRQAPIHAPQKASELSSHLSLEEREALRALLGHDDALEM